MKRNLYFRLIIILSFIGVSSLYGQDFAGSPTRGLTATFYANDIEYFELDSYTFCEKEVEFQAEIEAIDVEVTSLRWFINGVLYFAALDQEEWSRTFNVGNYVIKMQVNTDDGEVYVFEGNLHIGADIVATPSPIDGGTITGDGCFQAGETVDLEAFPEPGFVFKNWTENNNEISNIEQLTFTAIKDRNLVANFLALHDIILIAEPPEGGEVIGDGTFLHGTTIIVTAIPYECYRFVNWTDENGAVVATSPSYLFVVVEPRILTANFEKKSFNIILLRDPIPGGTVFGGGIIACNEEITVSATPNEGFDFVEWTEADTLVSTNPDVTFTVTKSRILTAHFARKEYVLTLDVDPPGSGFVFSDEDTYLYLQTATVFAVPEEGYTFLYWKEDDVVVANSPTYVFTVTKNHTLIAHFKKNVYDIVLKPMPGTGGETDGSGTYEHGAIVTATAEAYTGFEFFNWTEGPTVIETNPIFQFEATCSRVLHANFKINQYTITVFANPPGGGTVSGGGVYNHGQQVILRAEADSCYTFINWTKNGIEEATTPIHQFEAEETCTYIANFELKYFDIELEALPSAGGNVFGGELDVPCGVEKTVTAVPEYGYKFIKWTENGVTVCAEPSYTFIVKKSRYLIAHFELEKYEIKLLRDPEEGGTVSGDGFYNHGDQATVTAVPNECYTFRSWWKGTQEVWLTPSYTFEVTESQTLTAKFDRIFFNINVTAGSGGKVTGGGPNMPCDSLITVTAIPDDCYRFVNWTENGTPVSNNTDYTFTVKSDRNLVANFIVDDLSITLLKDPTNGGEVKGEDTNIPCGEDRTVIAEPYDCYKFIEWTENGVFVTKDNPYTFKVTSSRVLTAHFERTTSIITLIASPPNGGEVIGGGEQLCDDEITVTAIPNDCFTFVKWTDDDVPVSIGTSYTFFVTGPRTLVAHFEWDYTDVVLSANPPQGGTVFGGGTNIPCGSDMEVTAVANIGYDFVDWTENGISVSTSPVYAFQLLKSRNLVANFKASEYTITLLSNPPEGGILTGDGIYSHGETANISATPNSIYRFINWTENGNAVTADTDFSVTVTSSRTFVANFDTIFYKVIAEPNNSYYGSTKGSGLYVAGETARLEAVSISCYRFMNWTINGEVVSTNRIFFIEVNEDIILVANFSSLDFDTYAPMLWHNTFMLNLKKLEEDGYRVTDCIWYKNGKEEADTRTINQFSYSAGPKISDILEQAPTYYSFKLFTETDTICSSQKTIIFDWLPGVNNESEEDNNLIVYPNPVKSGAPFTLETVVEGTQVNVYNIQGVCVFSTIADGNSMTLTLDLPTGVYLIQTGDKRTKVVVE